MTHLPLREEAAQATHPKPHGGLGEKDGYNLMRVLELERDEYRTIMVSLRFPVSHA